MNYRSLFSSFTLTGVLLAAGVAHAAQGSYNRQIEVLSVCQSGVNAEQSCKPDEAECPDSSCENNICLAGPNVGKTCSPDAIECPGSKCKIAYASGPGSVFHAEVTIIVDDDVSKWRIGTEEVFGVKAVTILLNTKYQGEEHLLAQTYQNLEGSSDLATFLAALRQGPTINDTTNSDGKNIGEDDLNNALDEDNFILGNKYKALLNDLLWECGDFEVATELRNIFRTTGQISTEEAIIQSTPKTLAQVQHSDYEVSGLASVVRLRVKFRFVQDVIAAPGSTSDCGAR